MSEDKKDFVVKDRRIFAQEPQKEEEKIEEETSPGSATQEEETTEPREMESAAESQEQPQLPEINFPTFVASLNASTLLHLGAIEDPSSGQKVKNLAMAKQTIDILSMLEEKTVGNLAKEEENLLKNILYDLRLMYVREMG